MKTPKLCKHCKNPLDTEKARDQLKFLALMVSHLHMDGLSEDAACGFMELLLDIADRVCPPLDGESGGTS